MKLKEKDKEEIRLFIYYLLNGTLDFDLLNNKLKRNYADYFEIHPELFFQACCIFINQKNIASTINPMNRRVAEYICKTIEPEKFRDFKEFDVTELDFNYEGNSLSSCFKGFAHKVSFDEIEILKTQGNQYKYLFAYGASFSETLFTIWLNNIELNNNLVINQEYAINRAAMWFYKKELLEEWEIEI